MDILLLIRSCIKGNLESVKYYHQNGADINADDDHALCVAAWHEHVEIVKYLLQNGARINYDKKNLCFVNTNGWFKMIHKNHEIRDLTPEIQTELRFYSNRIIRTKSAIISH